MPRLYKNNLYVKVGIAAAYYSGQRRASVSRANTFILLEEISFDIVSNMNYPENCFIDHDLAFSLNCSAIETSVKLGHLNAFREDCERTGIVIPVGNVDLSRKYTLPGCTFIWKNIIASVSGLVSAISSASSISTNRLHIAILASLLNKQTKLY